jgi:multimeric flavodoxin WrbA
VTRLTVVAFNGSPRVDGNTATLIRRVFDELEKADIRTTLMDLGDGLAGCSDCGGCAAAQDGHCTVGGDIVNDCIDAMVAADGIIIGSPVYFADCTATTKALIERAGYATRKAGRPLARKVGAAVIAVRRAGAVHAFDSVNHFFQINEMIVVGSSYWNIGIGRHADGETVAGDEEGLQTMDTLGRTMAWALRRLHA